MQIISGFRSCETMISSNGTYRSKHISDLALIESLWTFPRHFFSALLLDASNNDYFKKKANLIRNSMRENKMIWWILSGTKWISRNALWKKLLVHFAAGPYILSILKHLSAPMPIATKPVSIQATNAKETWNKSKITIEEGKTFLPPLLGMKSLGSFIALP